MSDELSAWDRKDVLVQITRMLKDASGTRSAPSGLAGFDGCDDDWCALVDEEARVRVADALADLTLSSRMLLYNHVGLGEVPRVPEETHSSARCRSAVLLTAAEAVKTESRAHTIFPQLFRHSVKVDRLLRGNVYVALDELAHGAVNVDDHQFLWLLNAVSRFNTISMRGKDTMFDRTQLSWLCNELLRWNWKTSPQVFIDRSMIQKIDPTIFEPSTDKLAILTGRIGKMSWMGDVDVHTTSFFSTASLPGFCAVTAEPITLGRAFRGRSAGAWDGAQFEVATPTSFVILDSMMVRGSIPEAA